MAKIKKSLESRPQLFFNFTCKCVPQLFLGAPQAEKVTLSQKIPNRKSCDTSQNFSRGPTKFLAWSECLWQKKNSTICLRTSVPYLSCQCCFPWVVADPEEIWFWNGKQTTLARKPESKNFVTQASVIHHQNRIGSSFSGVCDFK